MRVLQLKMLEEVRFIDGICKANGLTYFLTGGSALGATRHHGFIPWDDDMDIALPQKDYEKLVQILRTLDSDRYVLQDRHSDFNYINGFAKFREREGDLLGSFPQRGRLYKFKGVGIDVFSVAPNSYVRALVCSKVRVALLHNLYRIRNDKWRKVLTKFQWVVYLCVVPLTFPLNVFRRKGELHYGLGQGFAKHYMWEQELFPVVDENFEDAVLPVPNNQDAFLTHIYGDWRQVPSEEQIEETVHNINLIKTL